MMLRPRAGGWQRKKVRRGAIFLEVHIFTTKNPRRHAGTYIFILVLGCPHEQVPSKVPCLRLTLVLDFMAEKQQSFKRIDRFFLKLVYSYVFKHFIQTEVKGLESTGCQFILYVGAGKKQAKLVLLHLWLVFHALERESQGQHTSASLKQAPQGRDKPPAYPQRHDWDTHKN